MMSCANVNRDARSFASSITDCNLMAMTMMPCAKSHDREISMKMIRGCNAVCTIIATIHIAMIYIIDRV